MIFTGLVLPIPFPPKECHFTLGVCQRRQPLFLQKCWGFHTLLGLNVGRVGRSPLSWIGTCRILIFKPSWELPICYPSLTLTQPGAHSPTLPLSMRLRPTLRNRPLNHLFFHTNALLLPVHISPKYTSEAPKPSILKAPAFFSYSAGPPSTTSLFFPQVPISWPFCNCC